VSGKVGVPSKVGKPGRALSDRQRFQGDEVRLGNVSGVFGIKGEMRLFLYNRDSQLFVRGYDVTLVGPDGTRSGVRLRSRSGAGRRVLGRIEGVNNPEAAAALMGHEIVVHKDALPEVEEGTWYHHEILDLPVRTAGGVEVGTLVEIHVTGENDLWIVRGADGDHYVPAIRQMVLSVEPGNQIIVSDDVANVVVVGSV
jgi:16S rRNA processing protein RimM